METTKICLVSIAALVIFCFNQINVVEGKSLVIYRHSIFDIKDEDGPEIMDEGTL